MEKLNYIIIYLTIINILNATTVYENGEDGERSVGEFNKWRRGYKYI